MKTILVTGSSGLVGSAVVGLFHGLGWSVHGVDNNLRAEFFGPQGDTRWNLHRLWGECPGFQHHELDIRDRAGILRLVRDVQPDAVTHAAAQPSHDLAADRPFDDFEVNAVGTLNLLEAARQHCPQAPFVHLSTNKVYGDAVDRIPLKELPTRWDCDDPAQARGIAENMAIDQSMHSLFGASKLAADILVQEYGRYFGMPTCSLRCGCITGPFHCGVERHGFLSYLVFANLTGMTYSIFGHKGKQVRDHIHAYDIARFVEEFIKRPRGGEVYNCGGGRENACSILEAFDLVRATTGQAMNWHYLASARKGDHRWYMSDTRKMREHYPAWSVARSLGDCVQEIAESWKRRL